MPRRAQRRVLIGGVEGVWGGGEREAEGTAGADEQARLSVGMWLQMLDWQHLCGVLSIQYSSLLQLESVLGLAGSCSRRGGTQEQPPLRPVSPALLSAPCFCRAAALADAANAAARYDWIEEMLEQARVLPAAQCPICHAEPHPGELLRGKDASAFLGAPAAPALHPPTRLLACRCARLPPITSSGHFAEYSPPEEPPDAESLLSLLPFSCLQGPVLAALPLQMAARAVPRQQATAARGGPGAG